MGEEKKFETVTDKVNKALGIEEGGSIDDVINGFEEELSGLAEGMKNTVDKIDSAISVKSGDIHTLTESLGELSELSGTSKDMLMNVYEYIQSSDIMDPDVIGSGADLINATKELVREYLDIYKEKLRHVHNIELKMIDLDNKKELERYKHELKNGTPTDGEVVDMVTYTQERIVEVVNDLESDDADEVDGDGSV